jgi:hypothetical protein
VALFDFLSKKGAQTPIQKLATKVLDKRGMAPDRWDAIQALSKLDTEEAVEALLGRFTIYVDPSITDQEEKDAVLNTVVGKGAIAVPPLKRFIKKSESVTWPLKMLERVLPEAEVLTIVLDLLRAMDTEYERDPQRKLQLLSALESRRDASIVPAVKPFLQDVNEGARFNAVAAIFAQPQAEEAKSDLLESLAKEDSMRVKARLLDGFAQLGWTVDPKTIGKLPDAYAIDSNGVPVRR